MSHSAEPAAPLPRIIPRPLQEFLQTEVAGGLLLLAASIAALIWANSPGDSYHDFWGTFISIDVDVLELNLTLEAWVSDGLMAVFFFVVGLEIKRELLRGELAGPRTAMLPVAAALGGMAVPALCYLLLNGGSAGQDGWGIPMATDIAFSVGMLALLGTRVPVALKVFLLALAIVDDLGAIAVIAIFYTDNLALDWLGLALAMFVLTAVLGRFGVRDLLVYVVLGVVAWLAIHESGVHATVAGVALGFLTPVDPRYDPQKLRESANDLVMEFARGRAGGTADGEELANSALRELEDLSRESQSPLARLEHALHPWTSFVIVPLFALANAGVELGGGAVTDALSSRVALGVVLGLTIGKPLGIVLGSFAAVRLGVATLPKGASWTQILALGMVAGVGFTVSLFIGSLAFNDPTLIDEAKIGILTGSALIGIAGLFALARTTRQPTA